MTNKNISSLTAATTPLAGTELVPVWDGIGTKNVSVDNLTTGKPVVATQITASTGNFIPATSGKGVDFSAYSSAAGMTSKVLVDYEEGTWTPSLGGTATYTSQVGSYVKVGNIVQIVGRVIVSAIGTGSATTVSGLPFVVANAGGATTAKGVVGYFSGIATAVTSLTVDALASTDTFYFECLTAAATTVTNAPSIFQNGTRLEFSMTYICV